MNTKLKQALQNQWENICFNTKMYFKSHSVTIFIQIALLLIPLVFWILSLSKNWWIKVLDILSIILWIFSLIYYIYYWQNLELFKIWWEKYNQLYREIENYYKTVDTYLKEDIDNFEIKIHKLNSEKKPEYHLWIKWYVNKTIKNETTYANEKFPWWANKE